MFISVHRWIALGIVVGTFAAGWIGGYVMRGDTSGQAAVPAASLASPPAVATEKPQAAPTAPPAPVVMAPPSVVVKVMTDPAHRVTAEAIPLPKPPPAPAPLKSAATAKVAVAPERPVPAAGPAAAPAVAPASPASSTEPAATPTPGRFYKVQPGDTFHVVAVKAYGSGKRVNDLLKANPAVDPYRMRVGLVVWVPVGSETAPGTEPSETAPAAAPEPKGTTAAK